MFFKSRYSVHHGERSSQEKKCGTLAIFHSSTETVGGGGGIILVVIPHTCTDTHILAVILLRILQIVGLETPKLKPKKRHSYGICLMAPGAKLHELRKLKIEKKDVF